MVSYGHQGADETWEQDASVGRDDFPWWCEKKDCIYHAHTHTRQSSTCGYTWLVNIIALKSVTAYKFLQCSVKIPRLGPKPHDHLSL